MSCINYAHRGASEYAPENTLAAFYLGVEMGADGIETDIQRTKDGVLVLFHDDVATRTLSKPESISTLTLNELMEIDFGAYKKIPKYYGERVVTFDDFLKYFSRKDLQFALETKQLGVEEDSLALVNRYAIRDRVIFTSFKWESLVAFRKADKDIALGYLIDEITDEVLTQLEELQIRQVCPRIDLLEEKGISLARSRGFSVRSWGTKSEALMHRALALGVDGMTVNFPDLLTKALNT
jgi:Glycerophosphoryl diester phosphodiesterase